MPESEQRLLLYRIGERTFGVALAQVCEVLPAFEMTGVPGLQRGVVGLVGLRGDILPVIQADTLAGGRVCTLTSQHKFIIVHNGRRQLVLLAEHVDDIIEIPVDTDPHPGYMSDDDNSFARVVMHEDSLVLVLDLSSLIDQKEFHHSLAGTPTGEHREIAADIVESGP